MSDELRTLLAELEEEQAIARVRVNGEYIGTLWKYPYTIDIGAAVKPGENVLEIDVVNTWLNRLIGDERVNTGNSQTFVTVKTWKADTPLKPSGLLGPVTITVTK